MSYRGPLVTVLESAHLAQFSVNDCSAGGDWKMEIPMCAMMVVDSEVKAALGFPRVQGIFTPTAFVQWSGSKALGDKTPAVTTCDCVYLWYPI